MDRGAWQASVPGVAKRWTWLSDFHFYFSTNKPRGAEKHGLNSESLCLRNRNSYALRIFSCRSVTWRIGWESSSYARGSETWTCLGVSWRVSSLLGGFPPAGSLVDPRAAFLPIPGAAAPGRSHYPRESGKLTGIISFHVLIFHFNWADMCISAPSVCIRSCAGAGDGGGRGNKEQSRMVPIFTLFVKQQAGFRTCFVH